MGIIEAVLLGVIEGLTEFLPISSTGHLTLAEKLLGHSISSHDITAFTAIIQVGAIAATLIYFRQDIWRIVTGWFSGVFNNKHRQTPQYKLGWGIILGSIPIAIVGLAFKDQIETTLRNMWIVAIALILWSAVMFLADRVGRQNRQERNVTWRDTLIIGMAQCLALIPGVSRSGATISTGLLRGLDRVTATRLSFFLAIPALLAAAALQAVSEFGNISRGVGWTATLIGTITTFIVAYFAIAWLLKFIAKHDYSVFIVYRLALGLIIIVLLSTGTITAK